MQRLKSPGFTLLAMIMILVIIVILVGVFLLFSSGSKQVGLSRDSARRADISTIYKAVNQYLIDKGTLPPTITDKLTFICDPLQRCTGVNLSALIPTYIPNVPKDPLATTDAGYEIAKVGNNVYVEAPYTEVGFVSQSGYSSSTPVAAFIGVLPAGHVPPAASSIKPER
jgi:type II secretory pathway pseudopilin PulG